MIGSITFCLALYSTNLIKRAVRITNNSVDLSAVLPKYYKFTNIFSKAKAEILAFYCLYDLQIKLENKEKLLIGTIYSLSIAEQKVFKKFIYENLNIRFI